MKDISVSMGAVAARRKYNLNEFDSGIRAQVILREMSM